MKRKISHRVGKTAVLLITTLLFITACQTDETETASISVPIPAEEVQAQEIGSAPYDIVMSVITSPRCMNCHPSDDRPRQRDEQVVHILNVERGEDNHNGPVQTCETCHHEENNEYSNAPGAPHWGLAPKSMGWLGKSNAEIAQTLLDPTLNGGRSHEDLLHHMSEDALVLWAWEPGEGRMPPPVPHDEFVAALEAWLAAGAPIPSE
ncbi:MAG: hypothetical protein AAF614_21685 [Chloroflexota bacterium]